MNLSSHTLSLVSQAMLEKLESHRNNIEETADRLYHVHTALTQEAPHIYPFSSFPHAPALQFESLFCLEHSIKTKDINTI